MSSILSFALGVVFGLLLSRQLNIRFGKRRRSSQKISSWMDMTAAERSEADEQEKLKAVRGKKVLLNKIQEEFKEVKKNSKKLKS